jgi:capsular polysaccharide transport system permease protein
MLRLEPVQKHPIHGKDTHASAGRAYRPCVVSTSTCTAISSGLCRFLPGSKALLYGGLLFKGKTSVNLPPRSSEILQSVRRREHMMSLASDLLIRYRYTKLVEQIAQFRRIMGAVLIQDMRSRFGTSHIGYLVAIAWPLSHIVIITLMYMFRVTIAPVGDSPTMFVATGIVPYVLCLYPARLLAMAIARNRQLLNIPVIKPLHLIFSRCILETLNAVIVLALFMFAVSMFDVDILPVDTGEAAKAIGAAMFLGIGLGFLNVVMCALIGQYFVVFFNLLMIGLYVLSGVYLPPTAMPESVREYMTYNPLLQLVEWLRSAYYTSYDSELINKSLILWVGGIGLTLGLIGERFVRGKFFS